MGKTVLAIDLGASSGRAILGNDNEQGEVELTEVHRFPNGFKEVDGHLVWDVDSLFREIKTGIKKALKNARTLPPCPLIPGALITCYFKAITL